MNPIVFLTDRDFSIQQGKRGNNLCVNMGGLVLVLFVSHNCPHCHNFLPQYKALSTKYQMCQFGIIDVGKFQNVAIASIKTSSPIESVPCLLLYLNKKPIIIYTGTFSFNAVAEFLQNKILSNIQNRTSFVPQKQNGYDGRQQINPDDIELMSSSGPIPYSVVCDAEKCYLTYRDIMNKQISNIADGCPNCRITNTL